MVQLCSYFIVGFILQVIVITSLAPAWWLLIMWSVLLILLFKHRAKLYLPPDHPYFFIQKKNILYTLFLLFLLLISYLFLTYDVNNKQKAYLQSPLHQAVELQQAVQLTGRLASFTTQDGNRIRFDLVVQYVGHEKLKQPHVIRIQRYARTEEELHTTQEWNKGDWWQGTVQISYPQGARNPGAFNYKKFLSNQDIFFTAQVLETNWKVISSQNIIDRLRVLLEKQRNQWIRQTNKIFSDEIVGIVQAMTVGYRGELDSTLVELYQQLGIVHILAISGLHVGIVVYSIYTLCMKLPLTKEKVIWIVIGFIPIFIILAGAGPSVIRAGLMAMIGLFLQRYQLWKHSLLILYAVFVINVLIDPFLIYQIGFQLSYFVTFMLIASFPYVSKWLGFFIRSKKINHALTIALTAELASLPFLLYHFHIFSPISIIVNFLVIPIYSVFFIPASFILTLASYVHPALSQFGVTLYEYVIQQLHIVLESVKGWTFSVLYFGRPKAWWLIGYSCILLMWFIYIELNRRVLSYLMFACIGVWCLLHLSLPYMDQRAHIMLLDVGQGEAIVIESPYRQQVVMIDLGGQVQFGQEEEWAKRQSAFEVGKDIVLPYLRYRGINRIDRVIFTHGHYDHIAGIQGLLGKIKVDAVYKSPIQPISDFERELLLQIQEAGIPILPLMQGDSWQSRHASFHVVYPTIDQVWIEWLDNPHDYNLVVFNQFYQYRFLWTGDVTIEGEQKIMEQYPKLKVDVLNLGHHGSNTSTAGEFLQQLEPKIGLISVGRNNIYRHPHTDVLQRMEEYAEMDVYRTDQHGGIYIQVGRNGLRLFTTID